MNIAKFYRPILLTVLHHVYEKREAKDEGLEPLAEGTEPVGHDEDTAEYSVHAPLLLTHLQGPVGLVLVIVDQVYVDPHHREQCVPQDHSYILFICHVVSWIELNLLIQ